MVKPFVSSKKLAIFQFAVGSRCSFSGRFSSAEYLFVRDLFRARAYCTLPTHFYFYEICEPLPKFETLEGVLRFFQGVSFSTRTSIANCLILFFPKICIFPGRYIKDSKTFLDWLRLTIEVR